MWRDSREATWKPPKPRCDVPAAAGVAGMLRVAGCPAAAPGGGARAEVTHRTQAKQRGGRSHHDGQSQGPHAPPSPNPSHAGVAPSAETAAVLATEPGGHTLAVRGEAQESKAWTARGEDSALQGEKRHKANGQCESRSPTYPQRLESSGCCGLQDARQQRRREHAPRSHIEHKRKRAKSPRRAIARSTYPPPPNPSHAGPAPGAE